MEDLTDIRYDTENAVATITLNRPEKRNAIRPQTLADLDTALDQAETVDEVTVVRINAAGDMFCAGADLTAIREAVTDQEQLEGFLRQWHRVYDAIADSPLPVLAEVEGAALAGGLELVAACDLAVAGTEAEFGDQHVNVNLIPGGGNTQRLPRLIGRRRAKELMFTGERIDAQTAHEWGLVNRLADGPEVTDVARSLAEQIAENRGKVLQRMKELVDDGVEAPLDQSLSRERDTAVLHLQSQVAREGLEQFLR